MATEIEMKLRVPSTEVLDKILSDPQLMEYMKDDYEVRQMSSIYYDTPDRLLHEKKWTLRLRNEGGHLVAAFKTSSMMDGAGFFTRGEWQCSVDRIEEAIPMLVRHGAPPELHDLLNHKGLVACCGAEFQRRSVCLYMDDGVRIELAGDSGYLFNGDKKEDLCELELELLYGDVASLPPLCQQLKEDYDLTEETLSKYQRARALGDHAEN